MKDGCCIVNPVLCTVTVVHARSMIWCKREFCYAGAPKQALSIRRCVGACSPKRLPCSWALMMMMMIMMMIMMMMMTSLMMMMTTCVGAHQPPPISALSWAAAPVVDSTTRDIGAWQVIDSHVAIFVIFIAIFIILVFIFIVNNPPIGAWQVIDSRYPIQCLYV